MDSIQEPLRKIIEAPVRVRLADMSACRSWDNRGKLRDSLSRDAGADNSHGRVLITILWKQPYVLL